MYMYFKLKNEKQGNSAIMAIKLRIDAYKNVTKLHTVVLTSGLRVLFHFQLYFICFNHGGLAVLSVGGRNRSNRRKRQTC